MVWYGMRDCGGFAPWRKQGYVYRNLKLGGYRIFYGSVNMLEAKIYIKNINKSLLKIKKSGVSSINWEGGWSLPPRGV